MATFELKSRHINCAAATVRPGKYPKMDKREPDQVGWRVTGGGEALGDPTVNLAAYGDFPAPGCVFVKITSEYEGWLESLEKAGFVEQTGRILPVGYVDRYAAECRVLRPELLAA